MSSFLTNDTINSSLIVGGLLVAIATIAIRSRFTLAAEKVQLERQRTLLAEHFDTSNRSPWYELVADRLTYELASPASPNLRAASPTTHVLVWPHGVFDPAEHGMLTGTRPGTFSFAGLDVLFVVDPIVRSKGDGWDRQPIGLNSPLGQHAMYQHERLLADFGRTQRRQTDRRAAADAQIERVVRRVLTETQSS